MPIKGSEPPETGKSKRPFKRTSQQSRQLPEREREFVAAVETVLMFMRLSGCLDAQPYAQSHMEGGRAVRNQGHVFKGFLG